MEIHTRTATLVHTEPFVISRGTSTESVVVQTAVTWQGLTGYGEGAPDERYNESVESAVAFLEGLGPRLGDDPLAIEAILARVNQLPGEMGAKCALDGALHDLLGKICGQPLYRILGLDPVPPPTSYTISIDTVEGTADRARRAAGYHALKIKVGGPDDLDRVRAVRREAPTALIRVDANEAWTVEINSGADGRARGAGGRADRAAFARLRSRRICGVVRAGSPHPDRFGRELPHPG